MRQPRLDPVQHIIDWQLRSRSIPSPESNGCPPSPVSLKDELEERLLGAIEASLLHNSRNRRIYVLHCQGYTQSEIGTRFHLTQSRVSQILDSYFEAETVGI